MKLGEENQCVFGQRLKEMKQKLEKAKNMRYKAEARLETLEREEKQILQELAELNVEPDQLEEEIQRLEKQIAEEMERIWSLLPAELKK